jgi:hypothetical protein
VGITRDLRHHGVEGRLLAADERGGKPQARRERMTLGELEKPKRFIGLMQRVPARERRANVQVGEATVSVVAREQSFAFRGHHLEHSLDEQLGVGDLEVARVLGKILIVGDRLDRHHVRAPG